MYSEMRDAPSEFNFQTALSLLFSKKKKRLYLLDPKVYLVWQLTEVYWKFKFNLVAASRSSKEVDDV